jgi:hypothetical protein
LIKKDVAEEAVADADLFGRVAAHREAYFRISWVDYSTLRRGSLQLIPPDFDEILGVVGDFERDFNRDRQS